MKKVMTKKERLDNVFAGKPADQTPVLGGWIANPGLICQVTGTDFSEYLKNPIDVTIRAYEILEMDGLIDIFVPKSEDDYRCVDSDTYAHAEGTYTLEEALEFIDNMPSPLEFEDNFDFDGEYKKFKQKIIFHQKKCGDMVYMPAVWGAGAKADWYYEFGYENYFMIIGLYPERARKLIETGAARGKCLSKMIVRAHEEGLYPSAVLLGEDICSQRGPMISPDFLGKYYAPGLKEGLKPLLDAGIKPVWHCDGDVRTILDMLIDCGVMGLQGFQKECGMTNEFVASKRTREGGKLLIFGPMSVTTELTRCTAEEVNLKVKEAIDIFRDNADLVLFTSNTINPDIPVENVKSMYEAIKEWGQCQYRV